MDIKSKPLAVRIGVLLEVPQVQDDPKEFFKLQQASTDLLYGVELEPDVHDLLISKLEEFNL